MRSLREIRFRLWQEAANLGLFLHAPSLPGKPPAAGKALPLLPSGEGLLRLLRESELAAELTAIAEAVREHRFPLLGYTIETGPGIHWRRDYVHGVESDLAFFRRIPYLNAALAGDHKIIWELNRHQHLVVLAQAWLLTGRAEFLDELRQQLESWWAQNPFVRGINWTSALEVAYRAFSWIWISHLAGAALGDCGERLLRELYRHGVYLEHNLSVYFAPNTHLTGEAVVLHALGVLFPAWPRAKAWKRLGGRIVAEEMEKQVREDGSHFEQSSAYHVYSVDLFLFHALLEPMDTAYRDKLRRMADYLAALTAEDGMIPLLGDDDGGRFFHPYGNRRRFGAATLAACCVYFGGNDWPCAPADLPEMAVWWFGKKAFQDRTGLATSRGVTPRLFPDAGVAVLSTGPAHVVADTRAFGFANAGHSHAHALQVICRRVVEGMPGGDMQGEDILIDPGTYTYVGEPEWRRRFRGTAFHNTVCVAGFDQATGSGPFRWLEKPAGKVLRWVVNDEWRLLDAECVYRGFRHRRILLWVPGRELLAVADSVDYADGVAGGGVHRVEQLWHCGGTVTALEPEGHYRIGSGALLAVPASGRIRVVEGGEYGWQSELPGSKFPKPVVIVEKNSAMPVTMGALLCMGASPRPLIEVREHADGIRFAVGANEWIELPWSGDAVLR